MKDYLNRHKLHILRGAGLLVLVLLAVLGAVLLSNAAHAPVPSDVEERPFQGLNLKPVPLRSGDTEAESGFSADDSGEGQGGEAPRPQPQPQPEPEPSPTPSDGGTNRQEKPDAPADRDETDTDPPRMQLVTDLTNRTVAKEELPDGILSFYAYLTNAESGAYLRILHDGVRCSGSGNRYTAALHQGENVFTLLICKGSDTLQTFTKTVVYRASLADASDPAKGNDPPVIVTNLPDTPYDTANANFTLTVHAYNSRGTIYQNHIRVLLDGVELTQYTGSETLEYRLYLKPGSVGDVTTHTVEILAWDDDGNSAYKKHQINYRFKETGEVIGTASLRLDATVLGLGILSEDTCEVRQGEPASHIVKQFLEDSGYTLDFSGSLDVGFYLRRLTCGDGFSGAAIPQELQTLLTLDGFTVTRPVSHKDSLGEFDYTEGSGWMCSVNGYYPGVGLSNIYLDDGDTVSVVFTLAYGKDIGGGDAAGNRGNLRTYCGTWLNGRYTPHHTYSDGVCTICGAAEASCTHQWTEEVVLAPTCAETGTVKRVCSLCGQEETVTVAALGHDYRPGEPEWSVDGQSCSAVFTCSRCGDSHTITASLEDGTLLENGRREATCGEDGYISYLITGVIDETPVTCGCTVVLPATGHHTYTDGICTVCGKSEETE